MSFWSGVFGGSNPTLNQGINQSGQVAGFGTTKGEGLTTSAGNFFTGLLSGNPAQTAKLLAPQIKGIQDRTQQAKQTAAQFHNRSGGTNAKMQTADDTARAKVSDMVTDLTGKAATASADLGKSLIDQGMDALSKQVNFSQQQMDNWSNSIFGKGMTEAAAYGETAALGAA
jgi:hypothetical protein